MLYAVEAKAEEEEEPYQRSRHSYPSVGGRRKRVRMPQRSTERTGTTSVHLMGKRWRGRAIAPWRVGGR